jgi:CDGSH-type Zn-finger protein
MEIGMNMKSDLREELVPCRCGRSPSGYCVGLHSMSEEQYQEYLVSKFDEMPSDDAYDD